MVDLKSITYVQIELENGDYSWGTGYPVASDLILTAWHVVDPQQPNDRDGIAPAVGAKPSVIFPDLDGAECDDVEVIWTGERRGIDVALLRIVEPPPSLAYAKLVAESGGPGADWYSRGFAQAAEDPGRPDVPVAEGLMGKVFPSSAVELELRTVAPPDDPKLWRGSSGAPVFVGAEIRGVITSFPDGHGGSRFLAAPASQLLADEEFFALLGYASGYRAGLEYVKKRCTESLMAEPGLMVDLAQCFGLDLVAFERSTIQARADELVGRFLDGDLLGAVKVLRKAQQSRESLGSFLQIFGTLVPLFVEVGGCRKWFATPSTLASYGFAWR